MRGARRPAPRTERSAKEHSASGIAILPPLTKLYSGKAMQQTVTRFATHWGVEGLPSFLSTAATKPKYSNAAWHTKNSMNARYRTPPWTTSVAPIPPITRPAAMRFAIGDIWSLRTAALGGVWVVRKCNGTELSALATTESCFPHNEVRVQLTFRLIYECVR